MARMMISTVPFLTLLAVACARFQYTDEWESWKAKYRKEFPDQRSELHRRGIFESNMRFIEAHNSNASRHGYTLGMNAYGHLESAEFARAYGGLIQDLTSQNASKVRDVPFNVTDLPDEVDWRDKGVVTPVKDQGQCGSCWAFSTTGSLEGQHALKTGDLVSLSEQQLVDCAGGKFKNDGCNGGEMEAAFQYIASVDGEDTEESYPYTAKDGQCNYDPDNVAAGDGGYEMIQRKSESDLQEAVANVGPISVSIDASKRSMQFYKDGVYNEPRCSQTRLDHGVLAVGYGTQDGTDYWLVKNSWGTSWGMNGYIMMSRNKDNQCGIATDACYPTDVV